MELLPGEKLGKHELVRRIATGGMAEVYLAKVRGHGNFSRPVALKRMLPSLANEPGFREGFIREATIASRLGHRNIVDIFDFALERGELYLAMDFVHGVSLKALHADALNRSRESNDATLRVHPMLAAYICHCVALALDHAWQVPDEQGNASHLIHRDVSPHNVLLSYDGDVKLADFGIARSAEINTSVGTLKGKLLYMSPEQIAGGKLDARTDVYALGIVLYETALGLPKPLFHRSDQRAVMLALHARDIAPPIQVDPHFPPMLSSIIMKALERNPRNRFQSAVEFAQTLEQCIHRESESPLDYNVTNFMRRLYGEPPTIEGLSKPSRPAVIEHEKVATTLRLTPDTEQPPPFEDQPARPQEDSSAAISVTRDDRTPVVTHKTVPSRWELTRTSRKTVIGIGAGVVAVVVITIGLVIWLTRPAPPAEREQTKALKLDAPNAPTSPPEQSPTPPPTVPPATAHHPDSRQDLKTSAKPLPSPDGTRAEKEPVRLVSPKGMGTLVVTFAKWGHAWIDGEKFRDSAGGQEASPGLKRQVKAGKHVVYLRDASERVRQRIVKIESGQETHVEVLNDGIHVW